MTRFLVLRLLIDGYFNDDCSKKGIFVMMKILTTEQRGDSGITVVYKVILQLSLLHSMSSKVFLRYRLSIVLAIYMSPHASQGEKNRVKTFSYL